MATVDINFMNLDFFSPKLLLLENLNIQNNAKITIYFYPKSKKFHPKKPITNTKQFRFLDVISFDSI